LSLAEFPVRLLPLEELLPEALPLWLPLRPPLVLLLRVLVLLPLAGCDSLSRPTVALRLESWPSSSSSRPAVPPLRLAMPLFVLPERIGFFCPAGSSSWRGALEKLMGLKSPSRTCRNSSG
jgi:hypothetical protein